MDAKRLANNLSHSRAAYLHAVRALPSPQDLINGEFEQNGMTFSRESQIEYQIIELGWAFFVRYEGCVEKYLKENNVKLSKNMQLIDFLKEKNIKIPKNFSEGIEIYRKIRNSLHHDDGASLDKSKETELHLLPDHMENFFTLFCWVGEKIDEINSIDK